MRIAQELSEEEQRSISEGLSEEELAIFGYLMPRLTDFTGTRSIWSTSTSMTTTTEVAEVSTPRPVDSGVHEY
jgi:hypothetical protein